MRLYGKYVLMQLKAQMQYRASFVFMLFGHFTMAFSALLSVYFMFTRFHAVEGFTFQEVLLCFATVVMSFSLTECFSRGFDTFATLIGNGEFDRIMVRPRGLIFQVLASKVEFTRLGRLVQAALVLAYAIPASGVAWTGEKVVTLILMIISGYLVFTCLYVIYAALCFFSTEGLEFMNIFTDGGKEFGQYPLSIYGKRVLQFFTFVVPLALVQYYPFLTLIDRAPSPLLRWTPLLAIFFMLPTCLIWRIGVRRFKSTGS